MLAVAVSDIRCAPIQTLICPVSRLSTLVAVAGLGVTTAIRLNESEDLSSGEWRSAVNRNISETGWRCLGVSHDLRWWPLFAIIESTVRILSMTANILVRQFLVDHVLVCCNFLFVPDV